MWRMAKGLNVPTGGFFPLAVYYRGRVAQDAVPRTVVAATDVDARPARHLEDSRRLRFRLRRPAGVMICWAITALFVIILELFGPPWQVQEPDFELAFLGKSSRNIRE